MRTEALPTRCTAFSASATALMMLVALAATASAGSGPSAAQINCTATLMEQSSVRGVAAVVAAAAKDFFGSKQYAATPIASAAKQSGAPAQPQVIAAVVVELPQTVQLGEHLLNLPPPAC